MRLITILIVLVFAQGLQAAPDFEREVKPFLKQHCYSCHDAKEEFGFAAVENRVHVHDLHSTILHLMGFDHERLTYEHAGRNFRLTDVHGHVVKDILA